MRSFSELAGADLHWAFDTSPVIPHTGDRHYVLFRGSEAVVTAQAKWEKLVSYDVALECGEGTYFVHMDLTASPLQAVVWKAGTSLSAAGFSLTAWSSSSFAGTITTAGGRTLTWQPKTWLGFPTTKGLVVAADRGILLSVIPKNGSTTSGMMRISPALAADPDRAALIALAFGLCNEQALYLHLGPGIADKTNTENRFRFRLRPFRPGEPVGAVTAVVTGKFAYFLLALLLSTFVVWIWSTTLEMIDILLVTVLVFGLSFRAMLQARRRGDKSWKRRPGGGYVGPGGAVAEGPLADFAAEVGDTWRARQARKAAAASVASVASLPDEPRDDGVVTDA